ncbi:Ubiquitin carboxyl-terminal hydrolase 15 [Ananas comosus]|uniref:ubiquitinyl hydrolase 1 n=1 Tax=Ananas comosus TaxID=4615 RepID=A0A199VH14_ANACO|nr:Ubiquitin carboxyl-terminal hydrolase 15 [Ananas comosus]
MLQLQEAHVPALFLVFVVLPLVTYILLGIWGEAAKKKARISVLAQRAAEEALRVEAMACADVIMPTSPSLRHGFHECAMCLAPATTRCSRCKSVRYCSGKCQIIHWRQGHKQICQQWCDNVINGSPGLSATEAVHQKYFPKSLNGPVVGTDTEGSWNCDDPGDPSNDPSNIAADKSQDAGTGMHSSERSPNKSKRVSFRSEDGIPFALNENCSSAVHEGTVFSENTSKEALSGHKLINGDLASDDMHKNQDAGAYIAKNIPHQLHKSASETRKASKKSSSPGAPIPSHLGNKVISELETGICDTSDKIGNCEGGSASSVAVKGNTTYKKPPYTHRQKVSVSQKSEDQLLEEYHSRGIERNSCKKNELRYSELTNCTKNQYNGVSNTGGMKSESSKKPGKLLKCTLVGLLNDKKRNKTLQVLFPYEDLVKFFQSEVLGISPRGLLNCGNSCYANAVLQCLTCTKPLMIYLLLRLHSKACSAKKWCLMCELEQYASMLRECGGPLSPSRILSNMRNIGCRLGGGSQEDAHEFLRLLVMSMQSSCLEGLGGEKELDPRLQETTLIQQIFGGRLRSKVKCLRCYHESERYENIMDLTLEIHGWVESLEDALTQFTAPEDLDGENMYRCGRKQLSLHEVPNILTIVLKRFQTGQFGKINKCVTFPDMLDMIPFVTGTADNPPLYLLYAVVVHLDTQNASFSGHYVSYVKDMQGTWLRIDDSQVQTVSLSQVMSEGAYMLFYSRSFPRPPRVYIEKQLLQASSSSKLNTPKSQKASKSEHHKQSEIPSVEDATSWVYDFRLEFREDNNKDQTGPFTDTYSVDFSDATTTSSDWSFFTSSDESSFTTESTRDSLSTVDYGDNVGSDPISSIFGAYYGTEYSQGNVISCRKFSPCGPQTKFFPESMGRDVHRGRYLIRNFASPAGPLDLGSNYNVYGRYGSNPKDGFVQTSGLCDM